MFELAFTIVGTGIAVFIVIILLLIAIACLRGVLYFIVECPVLSIILVVIAVLAIIANTKAHAQMHLPPVEFDHPYPGKLTVEVVTRAQLLATCSSAFASSLGCAFPGKDRCHIKLLDEESMRAVGWTVEAMMRHERAHCNGWPQSHPGRRPYP